VTFGCFGTLVDGCTSRGGTRLFDDVESMLAELRAKGYRLGVLTNSGDRAFETAHRLFRRPFDLFVTGERILGHKPEPWHFRAFEQLARADRGRWVHVASSWYHDMAPARTFGVNRVWLDRRRTGHDPSIATAHVYTAAAAVEAITDLFEYALLGPRG
jgi:2-haloacid dehalogenase